MRNESMSVGWWETRVKSTYYRRPWQPKPGYREQYSSGGPYFLCANLQRTDQSTPAFPRPESFFSSPSQTMRHFSTCATSNASSRYPKYPTSSEYPRVNIQDTHAPTRFPLVPVTMVTSPREAQTVLEVLKSLPKDRVTAVDTEVRHWKPGDMITQTGYVVCMSLYAGPDVNFGNGPRVWIENIPLEETRILSELQSQSLPSPPEMSAIRPAAQSFASLTTLEPDPFGSFPNDLSSLTSSASAFSTSQTEKHPSSLPYSSLSVPNGDQSSLGPGLLNLFHPFLVSSDARKVLHCSSFHAQAIMNTLSPSISSSAGKVEGIVGDILIIASCLYPLLRSHSLENMSRILLSTRKSSGKTSEPDDRTIRPEWARYLHDSNRNVAAVQHSLVPTHSITQDRMLGDTNASNTSMSNAAPSEPPNYFPLTSDLSFRCPPGSWERQIPPFPRSVRPKTSLLQAFGTPSSEPQPAQASQPSHAFQEAFMEPTAFLSAAPLSDGITSLEQSHQHGIRSSSTAGETPQLQLGDVLELQLGKDTRQDWIQSSVADAELVWYMYHKLQAKLLDTSRHHMRRVQLILDAWKTAKGDQNITAGKDRNVLFGMETPSGPVTVPSPLLHSSFPPALRRVFLDEQEETALNSACGPVILRSRLLEYHAPSGWLSTLHYPLQSYIVDLEREGALLDTTKLREFRDTLRDQVLSFAKVEELLARDLSSSSSSIAMESAEKPSRAGVDSSASPFTGSTSGTPFATGLGSLDWMQSMSHDWNTLDGIGSDEYWQTDAANLELGTDFASLFLAPNSLRQQSGPPYSRQNLFTGISTQNQIKKTPIQTRSSNIFGTDFVLLEEFSPSRFLLRQIQPFFDLIDSALTSTTSDETPNCTRLHLDYSFVWAGGRTTIFPARFPSLGPVYSEIQKLHWSCRSDAAASSTNSTIPNNPLQQTQPSDNPVPDSTYQQNSLRSATLSLQKELFGLSQTLRTLPSLTVTSPGETIVSLSVPNLPLYFLIHQSDCKDLADLVVRAGKLYEKRKNMSTALGASSLSHQGSDENEPDTPAVAGNSNVDEEADAVPLPTFPHVVYELVARELYHSGGDDVDVSKDELYAVSRMLTAVLKGDASFVWDTVQMSRMTGKLDIHDEDKLSLTNSLLLFYMRYPEVYQFQRKIVIQAKETGRIDNAFHRDIVVDRIAARKVEWDGWKTSSQGNKSSIRSKSTKINAPPPPKADNYVFKSPTEASTAKSQNRSQGIASIDNYIPAWMVRKTMFSCLRSAESEFWQLCALACLRNSSKQDFNQFSEASPFALKPIHWFENQQKLVLTVKDMCSASNQQDFLNKKPLPTMPSQFPTRLDELENVAKQIHTQLFLPPFQKQNKEANLSLFWYMLSTRGSAFLERLE